MWTQQRWTYCVVWTGLQCQNNVLSEPHTHGVLQRWQLSNLKKKGEIKPLSAGVLLSFTLLKADAHILVHYLVHLWLWKGPM